jgi:AcrR family transcriptional regulator
MKRTRIVSPQSAPRAAGRPRSRKSHDAILRASIALIRQVGYDAVTVEGIAATAGVGKATVYRRWSSKETLVAEAIGQIVASIVVPDTGRTADDLEKLLNASLAMYADRATGLLLSGLVAAMARSEVIATAVRTGFVAQWRSAARLVIERGIERGELARRVDPELVIDMVASPLFYRFLLTGAPIDLALARTVVRATMRGFAPSVTPKVKP